MQKNWTVEEEGMQKNWTVEDVRQAAGLEPWDAFAARCAERAKQASFPRPPRHTGRTTKMLCEAVAKRLSGGCVLITTSDRAMIHVKNAFLQILSTTGALVDSTKARFSIGSRPQHRCDCGSVYCFYDHTTYEDRARAELLALRKRYADVWDEATAVIFQKPVEAPHPLVTKIPGNVSDENFKKAWKKQCEAAPAWRTPIYGEPGFVSKEALVDSAPALRESNAFLLEKYNEVAEKVLASGEPSKPQHLCTCDWSVVLRSGCQCGGK